MQTKTKKRVEVVLLALRELGPSTAGAIGVKTDTLYAMEADGLVSRSGTKKNGRIGRPGIVFKLTRKGAARALRLAKRVA